MTVRRIPNFPQAINIITRGVPRRAVLISMAIADILKNSRDNPWPHIQALLEDGIEDAAIQRANEIRELDLIAIGQDRE
jgi:hypothetical protein